MNQARSRVGEFQRLPAIHALIIQCISLALVSSLLHLIHLSAGIAVGVAVFAVSQGGLAAALSYRRGMAPWWPPIQIFFPVALIATHMLALPPGLFLVAFLVLLGLYWSTFRTQVPLYLSGKAAWRCVSSLLPRDRPIRFLDIGSGVGGLVMHIESQHPNCDCAGIELAPVPWLIGWFRGKATGSKSRFMRGDYRQLDLAAYDAIFAYLSPAAMPSLWDQASMQMRPGALLLSYEFPVPDVAPDIMMQIEPGGRVLYGWRM
jgi:hypothetical protein